MSDWKLKYDKLMIHVGKLEKELDGFNKIHRELKQKYKIALALIQKLDPTKIDNLP